MEPAVDPFHPVLRLLERYRNDVHYLRPPASEQAIPVVQEHLGGELPPSLKSFLVRWNASNVLCLDTLSLPVHKRDIDIVVLEGIGDGVHQRGGRVHQRAAVLAQQRSQRFAARLRLVFVGIPAGTGMGQVLALAAFAKTLVLARAKVFLIFFAIVPLPMRHVGLLRWRKTLRLVSRSARAAR